MLKRVYSALSPEYVNSIVYMLQSTEYSPKEYLSWFWRVSDFRNVMTRRGLKRTKAANLLIVALMLGILAQTVLGFLLIILSLGSTGLLLPLVGAAFILTAPGVWAHFIIVPLLFARYFIVLPQQKKQIAASRKIFAKHKGLKIAVVGSYGKTSMKELLVTVLSEAKVTAATPANKNVAISHALFAKQLLGNEEVVIIEYGEGRPGDVKKFTANTHPDMAIITGLAPAHMDRYPTLEAAGKDIFSVTHRVPAQKVYVNADSRALNTFIKKGFSLYSKKKVGDYKISDIKVSFDGTSFVMKSKNSTIKVKSQLLGEHNVGPLAAVAAIAKDMGLNEKQIEKGLAKTKPFEHRMQPRQVGGAWVIDDTYNGNIEGMQAGLELLKNLPAKRRIYVTPGLVDQGVETKNVHLELGRSIAKAQPDKVVLMLNSVVRYIQKGLRDGDYKGQVQIEHYPLDFYVNLEHFLAAGDVMMLQNDWTDNYN